MHSLAPVLLGYKEQIILKPKKEKLFWQLTQVTWAGVHFHYLQ